MLAGRSISCLGFSPKIFVFIALLVMVSGHEAQATVPLIYDVDGDQKVEPLTDGLLILRHQFGFEGSALTDGALGSNATITNASDIATYISTRKVSFDLDGNGTLDPLTDGLLLIRYLFGFTGEQMTYNAVDSTAARSTYAEIVDHIASYSIKPRFIYQSECTLFDGETFCFTPSEANFKAVTVEGPSGEEPYGTIQVQSLLEAWPKGEVWLDSDGSKRYYGHLYDGFLQNPVADAVVFDDLDPLDKVARWGAKAVVQVYGDRCMLNQIDPNNGDVINQAFAAKPGSGFFIAPNLVVTELSTTFKFSDDDIGWVGGPGPNPEQGGILSCEDNNKLFYANWENNTIEVGKGPIIQTFDGTWGAGTVVATNDYFALIKLEKQAPNADVFIENWAPWSLTDNDIHTLSLAPEGASSEDAVVTVHNPILGRTAGGWHITPSEIIDGCSDFNLGNSKNSGDNLFVVDFWSDRGSLGAPVFDTTGYVVGMIQGEYDAVPDNCYGNPQLGKNSLGILSTFFADPKSSTVVIDHQPLRDFIANYDAQLAALSPSNSPDIIDDTQWPLNANTLATAQYEVIDYGEEFTVSGFPKSEFDSDAFDIAKQATVMYLAATGCSICNAGNLVDDFTDVCVCTGVAVSKNLIIVNDHCVSALQPGDDTTFKTFQGQVVNATLVNRTSLDSGLLWAEQQANLNFDNSANNVKADVALLRTQEAMQLTPIKFADSATLNRRQPVINVGHPNIMLRSGPFVTSAGSFVGHNVTDRTLLHYNLPSSPGSSGSGVFNLNGELVGQIAWGTTGFWGAEESWVVSEFEAEATTIDATKLFYPLRPRPFLSGPNVQIELGQSAKGASSNHIKALIEYWAPGELPAAD